MAWGTGQERTLAKKNTYLRFGATGDGAHAMWNIRSFCSSQECSISLSIYSSSERAGPFGAYVERGLL